MNYHFSPLAYLKFGRKMIENRINNFMLLSVRFDVFIPGTLIWTRREDTIVGVLGNLCARSTPFRPRRKQPNVQNHGKVLQIILKKIMQEALILKKRLTLAKRSLHDRYTPDGAAVGGGGLGLKNIKAVE